MGQPPFFKHQKYNNNNNSLQSTFILMVHVLDNGLHKLFGHVSANLKSTCP